MITLAIDRAGARLAPSSSGAAALRRLRGLVRGRETDAAWVRPALLGLLSGTAFLYLWDLGASGWANAYYSAAVQAGTQSWKAFFFGSFDASNFITIDKAPAALWVMDLSARIFGVNTWSILGPEALEGVGTVALVYLAVRRWFSPGAALLAGAVMALTPIAVLIFRFNNPDALLVLLLTAGAYATVRALERGSTRWLVLAGGLVGTAFLAKMLQAFLVVPPLALVFLLAAPTPLRRRLLSLAAAAVTMVVASGWWVAFVQLVPAAARPYIGGSQDNSLFNLILGYNGIGRLTGNETGSVGGTGVTGSMWGPTGWNRMFLPSFGGQASWLIPAVLLFLGAGLWLTRRAPRVDRTRAALLLWGGWLLVSGVVFSYASGIIHPYYTVALAPAIGALVGIGAELMWSRRGDLRWRVVLAAALAGTTAWAYVLLHRSPAWLPDLRLEIMVVGLGASLALLALPYMRKPFAVAIATAGLAAALAGPTAYAVDTMLTPHTGAIPGAGPAVLGATAGPGGAGSPGPGAPAGGGPGAGRLRGRFGGPPPGFAGPPAAGFGETLPGGPPPTGAPANPGGGAGAAGGLLDSSQPGTALVASLDAGSARYRWVAATVGANSAAGYQLGTGHPVMAIGGFNGSDPTPTLAQFQAVVARGEVHYFIAGGGPGGGGPGGAGPVQSSQATAISTWVRAYYQAVTVDGVTIYDLTAASS